jgi:hypothetical protein
LNLQSASFDFNPPGCGSVGWGGAGKYPIKTDLSDLIRSDRLDRSDLMINRSDLMIKEEKGKRRKEGKKEEKKRDERKRV